jgi:hypothetical protein
MTYRTNDQLENPTTQDQNLQRLREVCEAKLAVNDDANALQLARDVLNFLGPAPAQLSPVDGETAQDVPNGLPTEPNPPAA